jgi:hypothetical protein
MSHGIEAFGLRYITSDMGSPEIAINQNLLVNYVLHKGIEDRDLTAPPGSPVDGVAYIPAAPATGLWEGHEDDIAYWFDEVAVWKFLVPEEGISVYVNDENVRVQYLIGSSGWGVVAGSGTVTEVTATGTVSGLTLTHTGTADVEITLGGTLAVAVGDVSGLGTGVATFLATPSSSNLAAAVTDETGSGALVFATSPTLVTPALGTPSALVLTNATGLVATTECIAGYIGTVEDKTYKLVVKMPHGATITEATTISESGTCTATFKINTTALGGTANSVSSSETSQAHASSNVASAGDDIQLTVSSNSTCLGLSFSLKYTRVLS